MLADGCGSGSSSFGDSQVSECSAEVLELLVASRLATEDAARTPVQTRRATWTVSSGASPVNDTPAEQRQEEDALREVLSPTYTVQTSCSHINAWHEVDETLLIFDWDDTLFPTTYVWDDPRLHWDKTAPCFSGCGTSDAVGEGLAADPLRPDGPTMRERLDQHASTVIALLRLAVSLAHVVIVTLAEDGWVHKSIRHFLPKMVGVLEELDIKVVYARSAIPQRFIRMAQQEECHDLGKLLKTRAFLMVVKNFYRNGAVCQRRATKERSWKNVISIGDSPSERLALQDIIFRRQQKDKHGADKVCRCKSVRLLMEPDLEKLIAELQVLSTWLRKLVLHDGDIDLDFSQLDDDSPWS
mmetsp:Transcript_19519/g.56790  ORF Transcript_19519/g.56790 Transcript_19519/m.56790 type:complete len:356 (+) Transcript_19519:132-1199(+)